MTKDAEIEKKPKGNPTIPETITRQEHLDWCKHRALEYVDAGDLQQAFVSFASNVRKHPETENIIDVITTLGFPLLMSGCLDTPGKMRSYIQGYD